MSRLGMICFLVGLMISPNLLHAEEHDAEWTGGVGVTVGKKLTLARGYEWFRGFSFNIGMIRLPSQFR